MKHDSTPSPSAEPPPQVEPAGWVRVPVELTDEMLCAGATYRTECDMADRPFRTSKLWEAILAAAPKEPKL